MKLIHLNVESFKYFDALVDFLETEKPDILSLVEATDGDFFWIGNQRDYIGELSKRFGWNSVFHPSVFRDFWSYKIAFGAAVLSRFPIHMEEKMYLEWDRAKTVSEDYPLFTDRPKYERYPYAWKLPMPFLSTSIETEEGKVRLLTTHFHVSYECLESYQIWQDAEKIAEYVSTLDHTPLILTGDFNIKNNSMAIKTIAEILTQQSQNFINTLTPSIHPLFKNEPEHLGHGVDHIFTRDITVGSCELRDVVVSDHLPLVLDFML